MEMEQRLERGKRKRNIGFDWTEWMDRQPRQVYPTPSPSSASSCLSHFVYFFSFLRLLLRLLPSFFLCSFVPTRIYIPLVPSLLLSLLLPPFTTKAPSPSIFEA